MSGPISIENVHQKIRSGEYRKLTNDETSLLYSKYNTMPNNVRKKVQGVYYKTDNEEPKGNNSKKKNDVVDLTATTMRADPSNNSGEGKMEPLKNDDSIPMITIENPPPFIKIGNHVFTTHKNTVMGLQSQTNFNMPGGEGNVYSELPQIYGVHPDTTHKYNLLLHNFGIYYKNDTPLFETGSCTPKSKDSLKQILNVGITSLIHKKNPTRSLNSNALRNKPLIDEQIKILRDMITKIDTIKETSECDITKLPESKGVAVAPAPTTQIRGPTPNCLQNTEMLQSFLQILTLMMGAMSDEDKRKNLQKIQLSSLFNLKTNTGLNGDVRTKMKSIIEKLLEILNTKSTVTESISTGTDAPVEIIGTSVSTQTNGSAVTQDFDAMMKTKKVGDIIDIHQFEIIRMKDDGNCLYNAILEGLQRVGQARNTIPQFLGIIQTILGEGKYLKKDVLYSSIVSDQDGKYKKQGAILKDLPEYKTILEDTTKLDGEKQDAVFTQYLTDFIEMDGEFVKMWGDLDIIGTPTAVAKEVFLYNIREDNGTYTLNTIYPEKGIQAYTDLENKKAKSIYLLYNGTNHYDLLIPKSAVVADTKPVEQDMFPAILKALQEDTTIAAILKDDSTIQMPTKLEEVVPFFQTILEKKQVQYDAAQAIQKTAYEEKISEIAKLQGQVDSLTTAHEETMKGLEIIIKQKEQALATLQSGKETELESVKLEREQLKKTLEEKLAELQTNKETYTREKEDLESQITSLRADIERITQLQTSTEAIRAELDNVKGERNTAKGNAASKEQQLNDAKASLEQIQSQLNEANKTVESNVAKIGELTATIASLTEASRQLQGDIQALTAGNKTKLAELVTQHANAIETLQNDIDRLAAYHDAQRRAQEEQFQQQLQNQKAKFSNELASAQTENNQLQSALASAQTEKAALDSQSKALQEEITKKNAQISEYEKKILTGNQSIKEELKRVTADRDNLINQHSALINETAEKGKTIEKYILKISDYQKTIPRLERTIQELQTKLQELEGIREKLAAETKLREELQGRYNALQASSQTGKTSITTLEEQIRTQTEKIAECESQATLLREQAELIVTQKDTITKQQETIAQYETRLQTATTEKETIQKQLAELQPKVSATETEKQEIAKKRDALIAELNAKTNEVESLKLQRDIAKSNGAFKDAEIGRLKTQLETMKNALAQQTPNEEIQKRLDVILPYLLVDSDLQTQIKEYIKTGNNTDGRLTASLETHKSTMCMIFQMAYSLIIYNNNFIDNIPDLLAEFKSYKPPFTFYMKGSRTRIEYTNDDKKKLLQELTSFFNIIFTQSSKTLNFDKDTYPTLYKILSSKDLFLINEAQDDHNIYKKLDVVFPSYNKIFIFIENGGFIFTRENPYAHKKDKNHSSVRLSILILIFVQLINNLLLKTIKDFITVRCKVTLPMPTANVPTANVPTAVPKPTANVPTAVPKPTANPPTALPNPLIRSRSLGYMAPTESSAAKQQGTQLHCFNQEGKYVCKKTYAEVASTSSTPTSSTPTSSTPLQRRYSIGGDASELIEFDEE